MPLDPARLDSIAHAYAEGMTSIRGRRVQRLLRRELAGFDRPATVISEAPDEASHQAIRAALLAAV